MSTTQTIEAAPEYLGSATYSPEDNKLRLYVGRVSRELFLQLRAEGWQTLHKQREAGGGDFVAVWTPGRRDTAERLCGPILDEDMGPEERAADRAERFGGYHDKRADEASAHADRYDAGPQAHGFQSQARAERAAARHDHIADRAGDAWSKAEYWQRRTAGVISHRLHLSSPDCRMGRIKMLESELRRHEANGRDDDWTVHYRLRLAYENQMLEAQGGRAGVVEMIPGGWLLGGRWRKDQGQWRQIQKVNKSPATGRVVSVLVRDNYASAVNDWGNPWPDGVARVLSHTVEVERMSPESYRAPTAEELAAFEAARKTEKATQKKARAAVAIPLVNPTDADAERLQAVWNSRWKPWGREETPTIARMTQAQYSAASKGGYARAQTEEITGGGFRRYGSTGMGRVDFPAVAEVRRYGDRVIVLTDKPQKPFPDSAWHDPRPETVAYLAEHFGELEAALRGAPGHSCLWLPDGDARELIAQAERVGLAHVSSMTQFGFTDAGYAWAKEVRAAQEVAT